MLPSPTADPIAARTNPCRLVHCSLGPPAIDVPPAIRCVFAVWGRGESHSVAANRVVAIIHGWIEDRPTRDVRQK